MSRAALSRLPTAVSTLHAHSTPVFKALFIKCYLKFTQNAKPYIHTPHCLTLCMNSILVYVIRRLVPLLSLKDGRKMFSNVAEVLLILFYSRYLLKDHPLYSNNYMMNY